MRPKKIGTRITDYSKWGYPSDTHPVYEYRGYFIARSSPVNKTSSSYFEIYACFEKGRVRGFDFYLNDDRGFRRLQDAVDRIDFYLSERRD